MPIAAGGPRSSALRISWCSHRRSSSGGISAPQAQAGLLHPTDTLSQIALPNPLGTAFRLAADLLALSSLSRWLERATNTSSACTACWRLSRYHRRIRRAVRRPRRRHLTIPADGFSIVLSAYNLQSAATELLEWRAMIRPLCRYRGRDGRSALRHPRRRRDRSGRATGRCAPRVLDGEWNAQPRDRGDRQSASRTGRVLRRNF